MNSKLLQQYPTIKAAIADLQPDQPLHCWQPGNITSAAKQFLQHFPGNSLYAVKANNAPYLLTKLHDAGIRHFDTASLAEIELITGLFPDLPVKNCHFMHPVKSPNAIKEAYALGVRDFVVDHPAELAKIQALIPLKNCQILVRLAPPSSAAIFDFSAKFGADSVLAIQLLQAAAATGAKVGLCFHIGSQCTSLETFRRTFTTVGKVLREAGVPIDVLDVGGGFPANYQDSNPPPLVDFFSLIQREFDALNLPADCELWCEPGRALCVEALSIINQIVLRKENRLYLNDGTYGNYSEIRFGNFGVPVTPHRPSEKLPGEPFSDLQQDYTIFGPTCDSLDVLPLPFRLPLNIEAGDWLQVDLMGAYTTVTNTPFNGFGAHEVIEIGSN